MQRSLCRCLNPLLADRGGKIFCPGCKLWVVHADDSAVSGSAAPEAAAQGPASAPEVATLGFQETAGGGTGVRGVRSEILEASLAGMGVAPEPCLRYAVDYAKAEGSGHGPGPARADEQQAANTAARAASRTVLAKLQEVRLLDAIKRGGQ